MLFCITSAEVKEQTQLGCPTRKLVGFVMESEVWYFEAYLKNMNNFFYIPCIFEMYKVARQLKVSLNDVSTFYVVSKGKPIRQPCLAWKRKWETQFSIEICFCY